MKDLSGTTAATEKDKTAYAVVFLADLYADAPEIGETVKRYGSRKYTLSGNTYSDLLLRGMNTDMAIRHGGGLAQVSASALVLNNAGGESDLLDDYFLSNDVIVLSAIFVTGAETSADKISLLIGVVDDVDFDWETFTLQIVDPTFLKYRKIPAKHINFIDYPYVPFDNIDKPLPVCFGNMNKIPDALGGESVLLAPCIALDKFTGQYMASEFHKTNGNPYIYYNSARRYGKVIDYTVTAPTFTIDSSKRSMQIRPLRSLATNDMADYRKAMDADTSTGCVIASGDNLDLALSGCPKLGSVYQIRVVFNATGGYDYDIQPANLSGSKSGSGYVDLTPADYADDWDFELIEVKIDGTGASTIHEVYLEVWFYEQESSEQYAQNVYQSVVGYEDQAARYADGGVITGAGTALENPAHILEASYRDKTFGMSLLEANINLTSFDTAATKLAAWKFVFSLIEEKDKDWIDRFARQCKMRIFEDFEGKTKVSVFDKTDSGVALFGDHNIAVTNPRSPANEQNSSFRVRKAKIDEVKNEIILKYKKEWAIGHYAGLKVASGLYRLSGTSGSSSRATGKFIDTSAHFQTDGVATNDTLFIDEDKEYAVDAIDSETHLSISAKAGVINDNTGKAYWIGPHFDLECFRSIQRYKTTNVLEIESDLIYEDATAELLLQYFIDYFVERRYIVRFQTWLNAIDMELGDFVYVDQTRLPALKQPQSLSALSGAMDDSQVTAPLNSGTGWFFREDDLILIDHEIMVVTVVAADQLTVTRAQAGTLAAAHSSVAAVYRLITKFEIVRLLTMPGLGTDREPYIEIEARECPRWYSPSGHWAGAAVPSFEAATEEERARNGWLTYENGEILWNDPNTSLSYWE